MIRKRVRGLGKEKLTRSVSLNRKLRSSRPRCLTECDNDNSISFFSASLVICLRRPHRSESFCTSVRSLAGAFYWMMSAPLRSSVTAGSAVEPNRHGGACRQIGKSGPFMGSAPCDAIMPFGFHVVMCRRPPRRRHSVISARALLPFRSCLLLPVANGCESEGDFLLP